MKLHLSILLALALVSSAYATDYLWGEIGPNDQLIAKDRVRKSFILGLVVTERYTFKQKDNLNAPTITAIRVTDKHAKKGTSATLTSGGPGSKGATIKFRSQRSSGINSLVEIWGR